MIFPQGLKPANIFQFIMYGLKPVPFLWWTGHQATTQFNAQK
jgi:hypothetical protein